MSAVSSQTAELYIASARHGSVARSEVARIRFHAEADVPTEVQMAGGSSDEQRGWSSQPGGRLRR